MSGEFVWRMEQVLDLYAEPYDPARPVVCFDEVSKELHTEVRPAIPACPGRVRREDYEYARGGTANLFMLCCPLQGWREVTVTTQRTYQDVARQWRELVDIHFPRATEIRLVLDNLNTHTPGALYETFPPREAQRILRRLSFVYTPKHASWLNMAEMEWSVLTRQVLDQRNPRCRHAETSCSRMDATPQRPQDENQLVLSNLESTHETPASLPGNIKVTDH